MPRAKKRCPRDGCKEYTPCRRHQWRSSQSRPLPAGWKTLRTRATGYDTKRCYLCGRRNADGQVDHIIPRAEGGSDDLANLAWCCSPCHSVKSRQEARRGQQRRKKGHP